MSSYLYIYMLQDMEHNLRIVGGNCKVSAFFS